MPRAARYLLVRAVEPAYFPGTHPDVAGGDVRVRADVAVEGSGFGNMSWGVCRKAAELGGKVVTLSGPDGYIYDPDGVATQEKLMMPRSFSSTSFRDQL